MDYNDYDNEMFSDKSDEYISFISKKKKFLNESNNNIDNSIKDDYLNYIIISEYKTFLKDHLNSGEFDLSDNLIEFANDQLNYNLFNNFNNENKVNIKFLEKLFRDKDVLSSFDFYINYEGSVENILKFMDIQNISSDKIYKIKEYIFNFSSHLINRL